MSKKESNEQEEKPTTSVQRPTSTYIQNSDQTTGGIHKKNKRK